MSTPRSLYQTIGLLKGAGKVLQESAKIASASISSVLPNDDALYTELRRRSEIERAKREDREPQFDSHVESDIFVVAREKSDAAKKQGQRRPAVEKKPPNAQTRSFSTLRPLRNEKKIVGEPDQPVHQLLGQSAVPSTKLQRLFHYGSLAAGIGMNVVKEGASSYAGGQSPSLSSLVLSPRNIERIARKLSQMRGAALKIGQMLSLQDNSFLPKEVANILVKVQDSAQYMPAAQLERTLAFELGDGWRQRFFASFEDVPLAAASIGQVHHAVSRKGLEEVVVKVQYPGVSDSIDSDLDTIMLLMKASRLLPAGMFLDKSVANARVELKWECDYLREAKNIERFRDLLQNDAAFSVPKVYHEISDEHVLTMEQMKGVEICRGDFDVPTRNWICTNIMRLCLQEIYQFRFMQTDPNWANFLYNETTHKVELLDFGACRDFPDNFVKAYANTLRAAVRQDRPAAEKYSKQLGYLTGLETPEMTAAHIDSMMVLGEPFSHNPDSGYDFSHQTVTDRVRSNIGLMLNERLTPPPEETYSLHRKLSGVYLLCARMNAVVPCQQLFEDIIGLEYEE